MAWTRKFSRLWLSSSILLFSTIPVIAQRKESESYKTPSSSMLEFDEIYRSFQSRVKDFTVTPSTGDGRPGDFRTFVTTSPSVSNLLYFRYPGNIAWQIVHSGENSNPAGSPLCWDATTLCVNSADNRVGVLTAAPGNYALDVNGSMRMGETSSTLSITAVNSVNAASMTVTEAAPANPPANRVYQDNVIKAWAKWEISGGAPAMQDDFNMSATITDNGAGDFTFTIETDMASADYVLAGDANDGTEPFYVGSPSKAAGTVRVHVMDDTGTLRDAGLNSFMIVGNQ